MSGQKIFAFTGGSGNTLYGRNADLVIEGAVDDIEDDDYAYDHYAEEDDDDQDHYDDNDGDDAAHVIKGAVDDKEGD